MSRIKHRSVPAGSDASAAVAKARRDASLAGNLVDGFTDIAAWTAGGSATIAQSTTDAEQPITMKITTASGTTATADRDVVVDGSGGRFLSFMFRRNDANFSRLELTAAVGGWDVAASPRYFARVLSGSEQTTQGRWHRVTIPWAGLTAVGGATAAKLSDVRAIRFAVVPATGTVAEVEIADLRIHDTPYPKGVVFVFDDATTDHYTTVFPVLEAAGVKAAFGVVKNVVGTAGYASLAQIQEMYAAGHDMLSHSTTNDTLAAWGTTAALISALRDSMAYLKDNGMPRGAEHLVLPGGVWNASTLVQQQRRYQSSRLASLSTNGLAYETAPLTDLHFIRPRQVLNTTTLSTLQGYVDAVNNRGGILVVELHKIVTTPGSTYEWATADLTSLISYIQGLDVPILRYSDIWGRLSAGSA
jgi:peptidoglycan/xylan/chitin deacetylase (PgdA/CDA1 family)